MVDASPTDAPAPAKHKQRGVEFSAGDFSVQVVRSSARATSPDVITLFGDRPDVAHPSDLKQARLIIKGDEAALQAFMDHYFPRLYRFALARNDYDPEVAEEVVQDTLAIAARKMSGYRGEASLLTWLSQICRRELVRRMQKERARARVEVLIEDDPIMRAVVETLENPVAENPQEVCARDDVVRFVQLCLDHLPDHYARALEWKYLEGLNTAEIAERMQLSYPATESTLARARRAFKSSFKELVSTLGGLERADP